MKTNTHNISRIALTAISVFCLGASAMAGPASMPMFMKIHGVMVQLVPLTHDMALKNGCKVCLNGSVSTPQGTITYLKDGDMVSAVGARMPSAKYAHGG